MLKTYLLLTIEVQINISDLDIDTNLRGVLEGPSDGPEVRELDARIAEQADLGAYNVKEFTVSDHFNPLIHKEPD